jgi:hypothetical protein
MRFWNRVRVTDGCWLWTGAPNTGGYGQVCINWEVRLVHAVAFEEFYGPIPAGLCVLHHCDNPPCVRPDHLWLGTKAENNADRDAKGRTARGIRSGMHKVTEQDVVAIRQMYAAGLHQGEIAIRFGMSRTGVGEIIRRQVWKHIP